MLTKQTWLRNIDLWTGGGTQPNSLRKLLITWLKEILFPGSHTSAEAIFVVTDEFPASSQRFRKSEFSSSSSYSKYHFLITIEFH